MPRRRRLACRDVVELVSDHLDGTVAAGTRAGVEAHLRLCPHCAAYVEQFRTMLRALRRLPAPLPDPPARARLLDLYRRVVAGGIRNADVR